jgi:hypothetical protein
VTQVAGPPFCRRPLVRLRPMAKPYSWPPEPHRSSVPRMSPNSELDMLREMREAPPTFTPGDVVS